VVVLHSMKISPQHKSQMGNLCFRIVMMLPSRHLVGFAGRYYYKTNTYAIKTGRLVVSLCSCQVWPKSHSSFKCYSECQTKTDWWYCSYQIRDIQIRLSIMNFNHSNNKSEKKILSRQNAPMKTARHFEEHGFQYRVKPIQDDIRWRSPNWGLKFRNYSPTSEEWSSYRTQTSYKWFCKLFF
jgi:hypothetical protein